MRQQIGMTLGAAILAAIVLTTSTDSGAASSDLKDARGKARALAAPRAFALSTEYSGFLGGDLLIDGVVYKVATDASVYVVGQGLVDRGMSVTKRSLYVTGEQRGKTALVRSIIVGPAATPMNDVGPDPNVGVLRKGTPR
jgi:Flp pilus assembly secretin CpaC